MFCFSDLRLLRLLPVCDSPDPFSVNDEIENRVHRSYPLPHSFLPANLQHYYLHHNTSAPLLVPSDFCFCIAMASVKLVFFILPITTCLIQLITGYQFDEWGAIPPCSVSPYHMEDSSVLKLLTVVARLHYLLISSL
jgi:hypothetical protein